VKQKTLVPIIKANIEEGSTIYTDEWKAYKNLGKWYNHQIVNHGKKQYVKGRVSVNTVESFNSHLKDNYWTYRHISRKYAPRYIKEFVFRYNTRKLKDKERRDLLLASVVGKRLTYRELIRG
jgi:transposase-like protein